MYRCFKLNIRNTDFFDQNPKYIEACKKQGKLMREKLQEQVEDVLSAVTNAEGVIDGEQLSDAWFPVVNKDIFISYSHNDEELALTLAGILNDIFGLSIFVDTSVWGSADHLLKAIDKEYCMQEDGTYNYTKRNFSTSHVHAMLTTSIMRAMDHAEVIFFLNTSNSNYNLKNGFSKGHTLSPWIYEEIVCAKLLRERSWEEYRTIRTDEAYYFEKSLNVAYPYDLKEYKTITFADVVEWVKAWEKRKAAGNGRYGTLLLKAHEKIKHPLNVLYEIMFGVCEVGETI